MNELANLLTTGAKDVTTNLARAGALYNRAIAEGKEVDAMISQCIDCSMRDKGLDPKRQSRLQ